MGGGAGPTLLQPEFPAAGVESRGHFLIRYCTNTTFVPDPARPARESRDAKGHRIVQEWGWLGKVEKAGRQYVRRITKHLRDGKEIGVVTDLLDEVKYPAEAMLTTYQSRWGIETVFHQITDVFSLRHLIGTMPKAVLFQMSFCLLMYNALQVVRHHLASYQACEAKKISGSSVFKCKTSRIGPSGPWPSGGCARSSSRSLATPDSSPGSIGPTDSSLTSVHRYAW